MAEPRIFRPQMFWYPPATEFPVHTLAAEYPAMPASEKARIRADMTKNGFCQHFPIGLLKGEIIWGRTRYELAKEVGVEFLCCNLPDDTDPNLAVERENEWRRHLTPEWLSKRRQDRVKRVAEARVKGQSQRAIAETEGISVSQVRADVDEARCAGVRTCPEDGVVTGVDGKKYQAEKHHCHHCLTLIRKGQEPKKNCPQCKDERGPGAKKPKAEKTELKDAFGNVIPKRCRDAYADPWIQESIDYIGVLVAEFWKKRLADGMTKRAKHYPFFNLKDFQDGVGMAGNTLEELLAHLKDNRPAGVCPSCKGEGCGDCKMTGLVSRELYKKLK